MLQVLGVLRPDLHLCMKQVNLEWLWTRAVHLKWSRTRAVSGRPRSSCRYYLIGAYYRIKCFMCVWCGSVLFFSFLFFHLRVSTSSPASGVGWKCHGTTTPKDHLRETNPFIESTKGILCIWKSNFTVAKNKCCWLLCNYAIYVFILSYIASVCSYMFLLF